jgi:hypothetical protein
VLAGGGSLMEIKMTVFHGRYLDIRVLINYPGTDIMTEEYLCYRYAAPSIGILISAPILKYCTAALTNSSVLGGP